MAKMAVARKDQERQTYAWLYGAQARKDGKAREVPGYWQEHAEAWLQGFDGMPIAGAKIKTVGDELEPELDESAISSNPT
jgi:hypothetical protein